MIMRSHALLAATCLMVLMLAGCGSVPRAPASDVGATGATRPSAPAGHGKDGTRAAQLPAAGSGRGGYYQDDGPGDKTPEGLLETPDAIPRVESYSTRGNKPYVVFGKTYTPMTDSRPFRQRGVGSWYGKKFHGQKTSSGERYDMYQMSAAHPTLPIPSYARVTNLDNGVQVIVRVNDRGPFHSSRIIDLSYTAALKLGYLGKGSGRLEVERLLPDEIERIAREQKNPVPREVAPIRESIREPAPEPVTAAPMASAAMVPMTVASTTSDTGAMAESPAATGSATQNGSATANVPSNATPNANGFYLQLGAYAQVANAEAIRARLLQNWVGLPPIEVAPYGLFYRLYGGPFATRAEAAVAAQQVQEQGLAKPLIVQR